MAEERTTHQNRFVGARGDGPRLSYTDLFKDREHDKSRGAMIVPSAYACFPSDEDSLFEILRDLAEENASIPFTVLLRFDPTHHDSTKLRAQIRALFRAAVYGRFTLLLGGVLSDADMRCAIDEVHSAFCELESEEREFNGYIPKGILIDTPLSLGITATDGIDFFCLDISKLFRLFTGLSPAEIGTRGDTTFYATVLKPIDTFLSNFSRICGRELTKSARLTETHPRKEILQWLSDRGFTELFLTESAMEETRMLLWEPQQTDKPSIGKQRQKN